jgi:hypothetical protein
VSKYPKILWYDLGAVAAKLQAAAQLLSVIRFNDIAFNYDIILFKKTLKSLLRVKIKLKGVIVCPCNISP